MKVSRDISKAMEVALGVTEHTDHEKINKVASSVQHTCLEKIAGIFIDNPTPENIEDFVRKYTYNELTFFPRMLEVSVQFLPSTFDKVRKDTVDVGTGLVQIKIRNKAVEIPFMISEGQLLPFDVIQLDGTRAPFSRENFQKILLNLDKKLELEEKGLGEESVYQGLEDYSNPTTSPGFMGDVLAIRDSNSYSNSDGVYVTATSEYTEEEKLAGAFVAKNIKDLGKEQVFELLSTHPELNEKVKNETGFDLNKTIHDLHLTKAANELSENIIKSAGFDDPEDLEKQAFGFGFGFGFNKDRKNGKYEREDANEMMYGNKPGFPHKPV